jgi:hypothetical protein
MSFINPSLLTMGSTSATVPPEAAFLPVDVDEQARKDK